MAERIGVIGLGLLGTAIADRLLEHGVTPVVFNRTPSKAAPLVERGAVWSDNPLADCRRVIISLYTSDVVGEVLEQLGEALSNDQILIDTTTGSPGHAIEYSRRLHERGVHYLDAPVSGSSVQTRAGQATIMVGGDARSVQACQDLFDCLAKKTIYAGASGNGSKMKLVTNLVIGLNRAALAEALGLATGMGLDLEQTLDTLMQSAAYSMVMETKGQKMIQGDFSVQARLSQHLKDVQLILKEGESAQQPMPLSQLHHELLTQLKADGYGDEDNSAVYRAFRRE